MKPIIAALAAVAMIFSFTVATGRTDDSTGFRQARERLVYGELRRQGIADTRILDTMARIPRHRFVPAALADQAYANRPLPIGEGQTISQPYIVALMTENLALTGSERVLEIGTGSGYQAAVLARLTAEVYTIEIKEKLHRRSHRLLGELGLENIRTRQGDGYFGWPEAAPFDGIMITAAVDHVPPPLLEQLKEGGRLILPLGNPFHYQNLVLITRRGDDFTVRQITGVLFVPMTGFALDKDRRASEDRP